MRASTLPALIAALLTGGLHSAMAAEAFPNRAIRLLIPFVPGGSTDFIARVMQPGLSEALGQPIVLDNRPGAAGNIAVEMAANAVPDGHTVLFGNVGAIAINPAMFRQLPVQPARDLACVNILADVSSMMVVHPSLPVRSLKEFIEYAKARPGKINWGSSSAGGTATLGMQYLTHKAGLDMLLVSYKGAGGVATAAGENSTFSDFYGMFQAGSLTYAQPSVARVGGVTQFRKVVALAEAFNVEVVPHSAYFGPGLIATLHCAAAMPKETIVERYDIDFDVTPLHDAINPVNGRFSLPQGPGLGIDPDPAVIEKLRIA